MNKDQWIADILQSVKNRQAVDADPRLTLKVGEKLKQGKTEVITISSRWIYATAAVLIGLLLINISAWHMVSSAKKDSAGSSMQEYGFGGRDIFSINYSN
jgi:hypothetical protein